MSSIGFTYNGKSYIYQSEGPGVWSCGESSTLADTQLTCSNGGLDKISHTLPESTTDLVCDSSV